MLPARLRAHRDEIERREILSCPSSNISDKLNSIFNVQGEWKSNIYEDKKSAVLIPSDRNCIVDGSKCHSCVQSFVILSKTSVKIRCHSCGEKKINVSSNKIVVGTKSSLIQRSVDNKITKEFSFKFNPLI